MRDDGHGVIRAHRQLPQVAAHVALGASRMRALGPERAEQEHDRGGRRGGEHDSLHGGMRGVVRSDWHWNNWHSDMMAIHEP